MVNIHWQTMWNHVREHLRAWQKWRHVQSLGQRFVSVCLCLCFLFRPSNPISPSNPVRYRGKPTPLSVQNALVAFAFQMRFNWIWISVKRKQQQISWALNPEVTPVRKSWGEACGTCFNSHSSAFPHRFVYLLAYCTGHTVMHWSCQYTVKRGTDVA